MEFGKGVPRNCCCILSLHFTACEKMSQMEFQLLKVHLTNERTTVVVVWRACDTRGNFVFFCFLLPLEM